MTVRMLVQWVAPNGAVYLPNNLYTGDAGTESGLVAAKLADSNLAGGTAYVAPTPPEESDDARLTRAFTWATRPDARAVAPGEIIRISDIGGWNGTTYAGSYWYSDGTLWHPVSGSVILARSSTPVNSPGDTAENTLYTYSIAAGLMGPTDSLRITTRWSYTNNANQKTSRIRIAGTELAGNIGASAFSGYIQAIITNRASNSQLAAITSNASSPSSLSSAVTDSLRTGAVDMLNSAQNLTITATKAVGGDTMALESVLIELLAG